MNWTNRIAKLCTAAVRNYRTVMLLGFCLPALTSGVPVFATSTGNEDMWVVAQAVIVDLYNHIAGISTVLAALMSAIAVIGAKMSNNQHKTDNAWDWLRRIWICWAIINGIGAFIAYIAPLFASHVPSLEDALGSASSGGGNSSGSVV